MGSIIRINNVDLTQFTWKGQPVVTRQQVADVHGISVKTIESAHNRNAKHFQRGEDYFRLTGADIRAVLQDAANQETQQLIVYTESGYLLLAKPLTDDVSWRVQKELRKSYFHLRDLALMDRDVELLKRRIFLAEPQHWERRFPNEVRDHICRLWGCKPGSWLRQIYKDIFYDRAFEPWARLEIRQMNPRKNGDLARKDHQYINFEDVGGMQFQVQMMHLLELLPKCQTKEQFLFYLNIVAPKRSDSQGKLLFLPGAEAAIKAG